MANKLEQNGWTGCLTLFLFVLFYLLWLKLTATVDWWQVWAAPLQNKLAATEKIANFGWGIVSLPHKSESGQQKTTWALNILTVQVIDGSIWSLVPSCTLLITVDSGAIQSAGQGLHSLKKRKKNTISPTVRDSGFRNLRNFYLWYPEYSPKNPEFR